jgi:hypothetical protein
MKSLAHGLKYVDSHSIEFQSSQIFIAYDCKRFITIMQNYNFACGSVWVRNSVSDIKEWRQSEGAWEQGGEENILSEERWSDGRLEKTA